jgi:hypothetical protein
MNRSILKARRIAAVALAAAVVPFAASTTSAAAKAPSKGKRATWSQPASAPATAAATTSSTTSSTPVSSVHAIGGYVFYNVTYLEAVELYFAAVAAAPAGYTPPPVTSVSATTTVSGTVEGGGR